MKRHTPDDAEHEPSLLFDPRDGMVREPRLLADTALLGALHADLASRHEPPAALATLFQLGFLHGLRDAVRGAARMDEGARPGPRPAVTVSLLPLALEPRPRGTPRGEVALMGSWPGGHEADAHVARLGRGETASCGLSAGYTAGFYSGLLERDLVAVERTCAARGDAACRFEVRDAGAWRERGDAAALALLDALPFAAFRALTDRTAAPEAPAAGSGADCSGAGPLVHVWGPVMVMPFSEPEAALRGLSLIGKDPAARNVSVVVLDLRDVILDDAFGASSLESVVEAIEGWGAEPVLAGVSLLSETAVEDLAARGVPVHKDLPLAIAAAFQIAQAQRRAV